MHFVLATSLIFSCSHCCFLAEIKKYFLGKVSRSLNPTRVFFFLLLSVTWREGGVSIKPPLSKLFSNNATDLKLGSNVELP